MKVLLISILVMTRGFLACQPGQTLALQDIITLAQTNSLNAKIHEAKKDISFFEYQVFKSEYRPQVTLYGNMPAYNKEYFGVRQPDGSIKYHAISQNNGSVGFELKQQLPLTGGELSVNTDFSRFDDFKANSTQYSGTPFYVKLTQPLFAANELKWKKKIEPLRLEESRREYSFGMENVALETTHLYFKLLDAQNNILIAGSNLKNAQSNYEIEKKRILLGTTTEDKLLQLELQGLNDQQDLEKAKYDYQVALANLKNYIGVKSSETFHLLIPSRIPTLSVNQDDAFAYAKKNRPEFIAFQRKLLEAGMDLAKAKSAKQQVEVIASYGVNNIGSSLGAIFRNPNDQQRFLIGFNIPILDWGRRSARYSTAKSIEKLTRTSNELDELTIYQQINTLVKNIELLKSNISLGLKTDSVAQRRYSIALGLYQLGKLTITDLYLAQSEKDNSSRDYINALRAYWSAYYLLRKETLFDFENNLPIFKGQ